MLDFYSGLSSSLKASLIVTLALTIIVYILGKKVASMDPKAPIKGPMVIVVMGVDMLNDFVEEFYGSQWRRFAPILLTFLLFLALANTASLFGLSTPLSNINVALAFSFLAFGIIQVSGVIVRGPIQRIKDLSSPNPALLPL
ncbi:MAG: F0F1 ATP synthase subunit A, partial [Bacillota bacterium]